MSRKLYAAFVPLLAIAAFVVAPAVAQAQPHWYSNGVRIKEGTKEKPNKVAITTSTRTGKLRLEDATLGKHIESTIADCGFVWNPAGGGAGEDEITCFTETNTVGNVCKEGEKETTKPTKLPWKTILLAGPPIRDEIIGAEIDIECNGVVVATYEGNLTPEIKNGAPVATCKEATDSFAEFGTGSGFLTNTATGTKATVTGKDFIEGPAGDRCLTAKNP